MGNDDWSVASILGLNSIDWGGSNQIWRVWHADPCCGGPWPVVSNIKQSLFCAVQWYICGFCSFAHMYGSSVGQGCSLVPHSLFAWFCAPIAALLLRYNIRNKIGKPGNIVGDFICCYFLGPCAHCQNLRAVSNGDWELWPIPSIKVVGDMKFMN